jgi:nitroimidazol reductase NimA-like FMN-containing flavoprotein (pyridoxamine 5'-phosphate oxidase superfamily)
MAQECLMFIHQMSENECRAALEKAVVGRLGCARDNQPYVVPIYFSFDGKYIYGFTTLGQKIEWMRLNPNVCLEIDERIAHDKWMSVIVFGRYEELPDERQYAAARIAAYSVLQQRALWWEPAYVGHRDVPHSVIPIFYRIHIDTMTGQRTTPDAAEASPSLPPKTTAKKRWWENVWQRSPRSLN